MIFSWIIRVYIIPVWNTISRSSNLDIYFYHCLILILIFHLKVLINFFFIFFIVVVVVVVVVVVLLLSIIYTINLLWSDPGLVGLFITSTLLHLGEDINLLVVSLILGDFNFVFSQTYKHNGVPISTYDVLDFRSCYADLRLNDLNYSRYHFSWTNGKIWSKIDRVLANPLWHFLGRASDVYFDHSKAFSNHSPIAVWFFHTKKTSYFKFFNMWASHESFMGLISNHCCSDDFGSPMYILCKKLKKLKQPPKKLIQLHFRHISKRDARAEKTWKDHQTALHAKDNSLLLEEKHLRLQLIHLNLNAPSLRKVTEAPFSSCPYEPKAQVESNLCYSV